MRPSKWCHKNEVRCEKFLPKAVYFHLGTTSRIRRLLPYSRESPESLQDQSSLGNGEASDFLQNWHKSHARSQQLIPKLYLASTHTGQKQIPSHSHAVCNC